MKHLFSFGHLAQARVLLPLFFVLSCLFLAYPHSSARAQTTTTSVPLRNNTNRADYLIITPSEFTRDMQTHAEWRSAATWTHKALRTRIVTLEEINREFGDSSKTIPQAQAEAIRSFISHTLQFWAEPKPSRVLLVGSTNLLPAYRVKVAIPLFTQQPFINYEDSIPMDEWYVVNKHREDYNTHPQAAVGRVPGRTSSEIRRVLGKIRLFEEGGNSLGFSLTTRATVILDAEDNDMFDDQLFLLQSFMQNNVRQPLPMTTVNFLTIASQPNARRQVSDAIGSGKPIVMYYGHGAPNEWSRYKILTTDDVGNNLARNGKPFMMITAGCSQNYDLPRKPSIVEAMMLLENGGAVMTLASSGYSSLPENNAFIRLYFQELFTKPNIDIGTAMINAKNLLYTGGLVQQDDLIRRIALLGDPALVPFSRLITAVNERSLQGASGNISIFPNPASSQTSLRYSLTSGSTVRLDLVNLLGQTVMTLRQTQNAGEQTLLINTEALSTGIYLCRLQIGGESQSTLLTISR